MSTWSIDIGTTNTVLCRWDGERPQVVRLPSICRDPEGRDPLAAPGVVPSTTHLVRDEGLWAQLGRLPVLSSRVFWGQQALIGRPALERNLTRVHPEFVPAFKPHLQHQATRPLGRLGRRRFTAREVARIYFRELLAEVQRSTGERIRRITLTAPVESYEAYRAELRAALGAHGVRVDRIVDEPVAAAAGYGLSVRGRRRVLVVDFGGGTLDLAMLQIDARSVEEGTGEVLGKTGRSIGGDLVDRWIAEEMCARIGMRWPDDDPFWRRMLLDEARSLKEQLYLHERVPFHLVAPDELRRLDALRRGAPEEVEVTRAELVELLERRGLYEALKACTDEILARGGGEPEDVLMVGGSTLLPDVFKHFEARFGRDRVRAWHPFLAVAHGACALSAQGFAPSDYIVHEYAIVLHDAQSGAKDTVPVIPAGTRFPTEPDLWRRHLVPTCPLGVPERVFKLVVCEIGRATDGDGSFGFGEDGRLHRLSMGDDQRLVVPLNESNPALGFLDPPHPPGDRTPRLDVQFGVDADRWLIATVRDLKTSRTLMNRRPVVRLL